MTTPQLFCTECGSRLSSGAKHCTECGASIEQPSPPIEEADPVVDAQPAPAEVQPAAPDSPRKSGMAKILIVILLVIIFLIAAGGGAVWWFFFRDGSELKGTNQNSNIPKPEPPITSVAGPNQRNLIAGGTFDDGANLKIEGEGHVANNPAGPGNLVWQITGDVEMGFTIPLATSNGSGPIQVSVQVFIPSSTRIMSFEGQPMKGVRLRTRLTDRYDSAAVSDKVLSPQNSWQTIRIEFEDTGSGPYKMAFEGIWFQGPIYFDNIEAIVSGPPAVAVSPPPVTGAATPPVQPVSEKANLESWFKALPWFQKLRNKMPAGITLSVWGEPGTEANGWDSIEVREHHSADSGADPNVSPMVGMFRVSPDRKNIEFFDVVEGNYGSLQPFLDNWGVN